LDELRKKEKKLSQAVDKAIEERREIKAEAEAGKKKLQDLAAELKALKEKHEELLQEIGALKKLTTSKENEVQKNLAERHAIFKKCRMEEIDLPLKKGSLHDLNEVRTSCFVLFCFVCCLWLSHLLLFFAYLFDAPDSPSRRTWKWTPSTPSRHKSSTRYCSDNFSSE